MNGQAGQMLRPNWSLHVLPAWIYVALTFVSGSLPGDPLVQVTFDSKDKLMHLIGFWLMQWTHARAFRFWRPGWTEQQVLWAACASATAVGAVLEVWQYFLPHRSAEVLDWIADALGALLGVLVACARPRWRKPASSGAAS